jgi:hypothetical protein
MRQSVTSYRHGYSCDRCGNNTGVKSHFLPPILGWEVKTYHYTHHTAHYFTTNHPRGRIRQGPYPTISGIQPYPPVFDPASTQPRSAGRKGRRGTRLKVFSPSRPLRQPFLGHVATTTSTGIDKTSPQGTPASLPPLTL